MLFRAAILSFTRVLFFLYIFFAIMINFTFICTVASCKVISCASSSSFIAAQSVKDFNSTPSYMYDSRPFHLSGEQLFSIKINNIGKIVFLDGAQEKKTTAAKSIVWDFTFRNVVEMCCWRDFFSYFIFEVEGKRYVLLLCWLFRIF